MRFDYLLQVDLSVTGDAAKALKSFCHWQRKHNKQQSESPEHYDMAVLVTRKDLCSSSSKCDTLGKLLTSVLCAISFPFLKNSSSTEKSP